MLEKKNFRFYAVLIIIAFAVIASVSLFFISQMNQTISEQVLSSMSELAEHDKAAIESYIELMWDDLYQIAARFVINDCKTIEEVEERMNLESATSAFSHIYLMAEDGTVYTDKFVTYTPGEELMERNIDFRQYFENDKENIVARFDDKIQGGWISKESILYGIRLDGYEVEGIKMAALLGISDITAIQDKMVIDSFVKDGESRGHSALIDMEGNYIIDINKGVYLDSRNNLLEHLEQAPSSDMTADEVVKRLENGETFSLYVTDPNEGITELYYFLPLSHDDMDLYFIMSVDEVVFSEQTNKFSSLSIAMLVFSIVIVIVMLLLVMRSQNKSIRETEKANSQREFLSNMSHEIRTPLNGLIGMNHLILANIDDDSQKPQIKEWLVKSHSTANYLLSLVNDILDMSKLQSGKVDIYSEPLSVEELFDDVVDMQTDNITNRGVEFITEKDIAFPYIDGDATRITQILMNIVGNAAKFTPKGKYIKFSVRQEKTDDTHVDTIFQCEDAGIGISEEYIDKIFDSFSQERNRNTSGIKGTGLGMAISKLLANAMGGDITVESKLNEGSTFTVTIPSVIVTEIPDYLAEEESGDNLDDGGAELNNGKPLKILVAEDGELNAEILLEILDMEGFETALAKNGKEAVELFERSDIGEFDIILMDMRMPVMDGCEASAQIRKLDREDAKSVIIYACTANTFQEDRTRAIESGMDDFLTKPIDIDVLLKKIKASKRKEENK